MDKLVTALGPVFAAGFAVQQFLELVTSILNLDSNATFEKYKKVILGVVSVFVGLGLAGLVPDLRVLKPLGVSTPLDLLVTGFVLSAGTEGVNSILKFLKYSKEDKKNVAAAKDPTNNGEAPGKPSPRALTRMNLK
jgi:hypothetical protein